MALAALKQDFFETDKNLSATELAAKLDVQAAAIDTSKIPCVCGAPSPQNAAEFWALLKNSERQIQNGEVSSAQEVFARLNAKYRYK